MRRPPRGRASMLAAQAQLCALTGRENALLVGRAAAGIWAALRVCGFAGRAVLLPANTCYIVLWAALHSGCRPVLVDIDPLTGQISPQTLAACDTENPAAVIPAHLYGLPAPVAAICDWARARSAVVIEDAAQALGALADGQPAGSWGELAVFSFGQGKIVDVELGGALLSDNARLCAEIETLLARQPEWNAQTAALAEQWDGLYWTLHQHDTGSPRLAALYPALFDLYNPLIAYRLPPALWVDLPDALAALPENLAQRENIAHLYDDALRGLPAHTLPRPERAALWRYPLLVAPEIRGDLLRWLWGNGFHEVTRWYPSLRPMLAALAPDIPALPTPGADMLGAGIVNLPVPAAPERAQALAMCIARFFETAR